MDVVIRRLCCGAYPRFSVTMRLSVAIFSVDKGDP
jgi:hypothetical protein